MTTKAKRTNTTLISWEAADAKTVFLAGTFSDWEPDSIPMKRSKRGIWSARLRLEPGRYEFKVIADGEWCSGPGCKADRACPACVVNDYGTMNFVLEVSR